MIGNQWNTTGGSFGFLNNSWFKTFNTTARTKKAANAEATTMPVPRCEICCANGAETFSRIPIL